MKRILLFLVSWFLIGCQPAVEILQTIVPTPTPVPSATPIIVPVMVTCTTGSGDGSAHTATVSLIQGSGSEICANIVPTSISVEQLDTTQSTYAFQIKQGAGPSARYKDFGSQNLFEGGPYYIRLKPN